MLSVQQTMSASVKSLGVSARKFAACTGFALAFLLFGAPASFGAEPAPVRLSSEDKVLVSQIEEYLNGITTIEAGFVQMSARGNYAKGKLYMQRPGRMRFEYEPPSPHLLVADGTWFIYVDQELEQVTYLPLKRTPANFLLRKNISFSNEVVITALEQTVSTIRIEIADLDKPDAGRVTLAFVRRPLSLKSWTVHDPQGQRIRVTLIDPRYGMPLKGSLFRYVNTFWEKER